MTLPDFNRAFDAAMTAAEVRRLLYVELPYVPMVADGRVWLTAKVFDRLEALQDAESGCLGGRGVELCQEFA